LQASPLFEFDPNLVRSDRNRRSPNRLTYSPEPKTPRPRTPKPCVVCDRRIQGILRTLNFDD
jgi:hypothetical protein